MDKSLELGDIFCLLSQGIKDHMIVRRANYIRLPQLTLQESDLSLLLRYLQTLDTQKSHY